MSDALEERGRGKRVVLCLPKCGWKEEKKVLHCAAEGEGNGNRFVVGGRGERENLVLSIPVIKDGKKKKASIGWTCVAGGGGGRVLWTGEKKGKGAPLPLVCIWNRGEMEVSSHSNFYGGGRRVQPRREGGGSSMRNIS